MTRFEPQLNYFVASTEELLGNATTEKMFEAMLRFLMMEPAEIGGLPEADKILLVGLASLAMLYLLHRREEVVAS